MYIAHEQVYSPFLLLIWKDKDLHSNVIPILGGFHRLRVLQKIPYKRYQCIQDKDGLFIQRLLHQDQRNEVLKDGITFSLCVCTIFQTKVELHTKNIDPFILSKLIELRKSPLPALVKEIIKLDAFKDIKQHIVSTMGSESQVTVMYLKDVSAMLAIISARK